MAQFYNIKQYQPGGEWSSTYGMMDSFFLDIEGHEGDTVMTNKKQGNTPRLGNVYGELIFKKVGKKGQNVYQFKQLQTPDGMTAPASVAQQAPQVAVERGQNIPEWFAPYAVMIKAIYDSVSVVKVDAPKAVPFESPKPVATPAPEAPKDDVVPGTNLSKAELEDIFGGSMEPIDIEE